MESNQWTTYSHGLCTFNIDSILYTWDFTYTRFLPLIYLQNEMWYLQGTQVMNFIFAYILLYNWLTSLVVLFSFLVRVLWRYENWDSAPNDVTCVNTLQLITCDRDTIMECTTRWVLTHDIILYLWQAPFIDVKCRNLIITTRIEWIIHACIYIYGIFENKLLFCGIEHKSG